MRRPAVKKILALSLILLLSLLPAAQAERISIPSLLTFSQISSDREYVREDTYVQTVYPSTANENVNREMRALIDEMTARGRPFLPSGGAKQDPPAYLDVGAYIFRTGLKWMSFLTIARVAYGKEQQYVDFDARVYDMETGAQVTLSELFDSESPAWALMESAVQEQLTAYFEGTAPNAEALSALMDRETLKNTPFTLTAGKLSLHYRADSLYPGRNTLMHVNLYYSALRPLMTDAGREMTDNSMYKMIALTYDDGGARGYSLNVMNELRLAGASATFFVVGSTIRNNHDILCREHDALFTVASHNYEHVYDNLTTENILSWKERFDRELNAVTGTRPAMMRAPGGKYARYISSHVGIPLIQWSANIGDAGGTKVNPVTIARKVVDTAKDGVITLMHDMNPLANQYTALFLPELEARGFLCVTVDELFDHYGVPLEPDTLYYGCVDEAQMR